ncbi:MAG TPA: lipid A biosynthesis acyltransferase [Gammaproteobacteria bacterium]|jgi:KDO2-lipid IV(A) lauroyltransferase
MPADNESPPVSYAALRYAAAWFIYAFMRIIVCLPLDWQLAVGKRFGVLSRSMLRSRRMIVDRNLEICFPELTARAREALARAHFAAMGASLVEMAMGWFGPLETIRRRVRVVGAEHLARARAHGRGVILYSGHYTTFEFFFAVVQPLAGRLCGMYKEARNPLMNTVMTKGRLRSVNRLFADDSVRDMFRELAANSVVWYASDQSYSRKGSALLPFFGEPAMTNTSISRLARASGAVVLPYFCRRLDDGHYEVAFGAPLENFPTDDPALDTSRLVARIEDFVRTCPEQYLWAHRRFKGRPPPYQDPYAED